MRKRSVITLTAALAVMFGAQGSAQTSPPPVVEFVGAYRWAMPVENFGGFSGLEVLAGGNDFVVISDAGFITKGTFDRDNADKIESVGITGLLPLRAIRGGNITGVNDDAEGLAVDDDGAIYISFEGFHRLRKYASPDAKAEFIRPHPDFQTMQNNSSLEALAIGADGKLYTIPERSGHLSRPFPVYRYNATVFDQPFNIPRRGPFLVVGADIGPDGNFYLLERHLNGIFGFQTRIRRFELADEALNEETILLETPTGKHDNLEGIAVWRDAAGDIRITMVSDDNFRSFQRTEFVEYRVTQ